MTENLVDIVLKLSDENGMLRKDIENLDVRPGHISAAEFRCRMTTTPGATCHEALPPAAKANEPKSYRAILLLAPHLLSRTQPKQITQEECVWHLLIIWYRRLICNYGFTTAVKKTRNKPGNIRNLPNSGIHRNRPAMVGVRNSTSLHVITQNLN
jgi:hypothetical protein